jgi:hypothetical protein
MHRMDNFCTYRPTEAKSLDNLVHLIKFLVVELTHLSLNFRFNMSVVFINNYFLVRDDVLIDKKTFLVTDFVNLKIKSAQFSELLIKI